MKIIGLCGAAGCGKDTVGAYLETEYAALKVSFAAPMKRAIETMFDVDDRIWGRDIKEKPLVALLGHSPRKLAQTLGTEWGRNTLGENFWVDLAMMKADALISQGLAVVITDVRFNNEARAIQERGGRVIGIYRPSLEKQSVRAHISEAGLDEDLIDAVLLNDGTISELPGKIDQVIQELKEMSNA